MKDTYLMSDLGTTQGWAYTIDVSDRFMGKPTVMITQLYVYPKYRNNGVGKELLTRITNDADLENKLLVLDFAPEEFGSESDRLKVLYERFGFRWDDNLQGMVRPVGA